MDPRLTPADRSPVLDKAKALLSTEYWQPMSYLRSCGFDYEIFQELCMRGEAEEQCSAPGQRIGLNGEITTWGFQASFRLRP
jgi:hypothetical protein